MSSGEQGRTGTVSAAERLAVVGELASLINTTFDLDEIFRAAILKLGRVMEFRRASVVLVSGDRSEYQLHTLYDVSQGGFVEAEGTYPLDRGLTGQVIRSGEAMRVDEFAGTQGIRTRRERSVSALIVPLRVDDQVIGTLNLGAPESETYDDDDLELAVLLAHQIESSLHYSKLLSTIQQQREALSREHEQVRSERTRLEALIEASDAAILMVADDRVAHVNQAMAELLGLPREVVAGAPIQRINRVLTRSFSDPGAVAAQVSAIQAGGAPLRDRVEFEFPQRMVCQRTVATVRGAEDDDVLGHLLLFRDVTREAEAEAAKSEFVSIVSHELRTPLTSVKTSLGLMLKGAAGSISDGMKDLLQIALRNLDRLIRLVDDLLDLSRIESGRVVTTLRPVSLGAAVEGALEAVRGFAEERGVSIERGNVDGELRVMADADRLEQVVVNLVSNAIKYSPEGSHVDVRWTRQGEFAVLEISDEGPGIPPDQLEEIFDKFRQLERSATRTHGGAGLGLAISRTIIEGFGGEVWAESEEGKGSRFYARLRVAHGPAEAPAKPVPRATGPHRLLVVERDPDLQHLVRVQFEAEGWEVDVVAEGAEGLELAQSEPPDLIAVALELADMHGLDFLQRLRSVPVSVDIPTLLVGPGGDSSQAVAYGADAWAVGDPEELVEEARRLVARPRRRIVLLVEDDPAVRMGLGRGLRRAGYACLEASSGEAGLELARQRPPDVVITDWHVPGVDGLELLREFRSDEKLSDVPAIVVTGHAGSDAAETIRSLRAQLVSKPFTPSAIVREIGRLLGPERS